MSRGSPLSIALLAAVASGLAGDPAERISPNAPEQGDVPADEDKGLLSGDDFDWLDDSRNSVYLVFAENLQIIDSVLSGGEELQDKTFQNRFRVSPSVTYERGDSTEVDMTFDFEGSIHLRRVEKMLKLIIDTGELSPLPEILPDEEDESAQIGLQRVIRRYGSVRAGVKVDWPPEAFGIASWGRTYRTGGWTMRPNLDVFYRSGEDGFGTGQNFVFGRWWDRFLFKNSSGIRITEATDGFEWASATTLGRVVRLIEPVDPRPLASASDYNEGTDLIYRISGHISGSRTIDEHRVILNYRYPIRKNWLFLLLAPELRWKRDSDWGPEYRFRVGVDVLFWGVTR
ncbi:MAG: hypothetical protein ACLFRP_07930 [Puniceicoccaceae bacterium]